MRNAKGSNKIVKELIERHPVIANLLHRTQQEDFSLLVYTIDAQQAHEEQHLVISGAHRIVSVQKRSTRSGKHREREERETAGREKRETTKREREKSFVCPVSVCPVSLSCISLGPELLSPVIGRIADGDDVAARLLSLMTSLLAEYVFSIHKTIKHVLDRPMEGRLAFASVCLFVCIYINVNQGFCVTLFQTEIAYVCLCVCFISICVQDIGICI